MANEQKLTNPPAPNALNVMRAELGLQDALRPTIPEIGHNDTANDVTRKLGEIAGSATEKTYLMPDVIRALSILSNHMELPESPTILYPGSAADRTLASAFGDRVTHIDPDENSMNGLRSDNLLAVTSTFEDYLAAMEDTPSTSIDCIFSYNAGLVPQEAIKKLRPGGYIIANNWHGSANALGDDKNNLEIIGAVNPGDSTFIESFRARDGLGCTRLAVTKAGRVVYDEQEIAHLPEDSYTTMSNPKNTETLWLYRKIKSD